MLPQQAQAVTEAFTPPVTVEMTMAEFGTPTAQQKTPEPGRIKSVTIEGFRSLKNIQHLELPQLTVLIGANGAGKSTLIRFFEMLSWMLKAKNLQAVS